MRRSNGVKVAYGTNIAMWGHLDVNLELGLGCR